MNRPVWLLDIDGVLNAYKRGTGKLDNPWAAWNPDTNPLPGHTGPALPPAGQKTATYLRRDITVPPLDRPGAYPWTNTFKLYMHPGLLSFVRGMHAAGVEIRWCTTWEDQANLLVSPRFGLPADLPVEHPDPDHFDYNWKSASAMKWAQAGRPVIWTDDDAIRSRDLEWLTRHTEDTGIRHLPLAPDPRYGITPAQCVQIAEFVTSLSAQT